MSKFNWGVPRMVASVVQSQSELDKPTMQNGKDRRVPKNNAIHLLPQGADAPIKTQGDAVLKKRARGVSSIQ